MENRIMCPIINNEIDEVECFDVKMVAEGIAPEDSAPAEIKCVEVFKEKCNNCKNHTD